MSTLSENLEMGTREMRESLDEAVVLDETWGAELYLKPKVAPVDDEGTPRSTRSIFIDSYDKSNSANGHAGDAIRLRWRNAAAKAFIGWWDYTGDDPELKAWIGAHDEPNDPGPAHQHFGIEVSDASGLMQSRLTIKYDRDRTNVKFANTDVTVPTNNSQVLRIAAGNSENKWIEWNLDSDPDVENDDAGDRRWRMGADNSEEAGSDVGTNFKIQRFEDDGGYK